MRDKMLEKFYEEETIVDLDGFYLTEMQIEDGMSIYTVYDEVGNVMGDFNDVSLTDEDKKDLKSTSVYESFLDIIDNGYSNYDKWYKDDVSDEKPFDDGDVGDWASVYTHTVKPKTPEEIEQEKKAERELIESLCKSDTIVFHKEDPTTVMLFPLYKGKNWDVYTGSEWGNIRLSKEGVHELIERHEKIVCLGHGSPYGLFGGNIGKEEVPLLKNKKIFALWCYAATFFKNNGFSGHGILCSDNAPSEVWECRAACGATVSAEWIYNNITYWGECLAEVLEMSWTDPEGACKIAKENYYKSYADCTTDDERKVVEFNTNTIQVV